MDKSTPLDTLKTKTCVQKRPSSAITDLLEHDNRATLSTSPDASLPHGSRSLMESGEAPETKRGVDKPINCPLNPVTDRISSIKGLDSVGSISTLHRPLCLPQSPDPFFKRDQTSSEQIKHSDTFECAGHDRMFTQIDEETGSNVPSAVSNQNRYCEITHKSASTHTAQSSQPETCDCISYGVEWNSRVYPTSHCWFPYQCDGTSEDARRDRVVCLKCRRMICSPLIQCGSCGLVTCRNRFNMNNIESSDGFASCRPTFTDDSALQRQQSDNAATCANIDQHFWSSISALSAPCAHCELKKIPRKLFTTVLSKSPEKSVVADVTDTKQTHSIVHVQSDDDRSRTAGLLCLWCSRSYHQLCWKYFVNTQNKNRCDYGPLQGIIVRPQWLHRSNGSLCGFKAELSSDLLETSGAERLNFPFKPTIFFLNQHSGGQQGEIVYRKLLQMLNPRQVFLLRSDETIANALQIYSSLPNVHIYVFGGDGTVAWVLNHLANAYPSNDNLPVAICPLGTCNDLSRVLNWGGQFDFEGLQSTLLKIVKSQRVPLDRWQLRVEKMDISELNLSENQNEENTRESDRFPRTAAREPTFLADIRESCDRNRFSLPSTSFFNYMSFGLDAAVALDFHGQRSRDPIKFSSPWKNRLMYFRQGTKYLGDIIHSKQWNLRSYIRLRCDNENLTDALRHCHALLILNIPAYIAGTNPWGKSFCTSTVDANGSQADSTENDQAKCFTEQNFGDRTLEIIGLHAKHMATIHIGSQANRIAQCNRVRIELLSAMTVHMDGEPFCLPPATAIEISHASQVVMLRNMNE